MEDKQDTSLEKRLKEEIGLLRDKNFFSGISIDFLGTKLQYILDKLPLAEYGKVDYAINSNNELINMCAIAEDSFTEIKDMTTNLYNTAFGIRRRYAGPTKNLPHSEKDFKELQEMNLANPEKVLKIRRRAHTRYHSDHDKEFDRLKIISEIYRAILDKLASHASEIALYATEMYNSEREEVRQHLPDEQIVTDMLAQNKMLLTTLSNWTSFRNTLYQMNNLVSESSNVLLEKQSNDPKKINLADTIQSVSNVSRLCYQKPALRHKEHSISLIVDDMDPDIEITTNELELKQALLIMLLDKIYILRVTNKGVVNIGYRKQDEHSVMIYVKDNGPNIPGENPNIILERAENDTLNRKFNISYVQRSIGDYNPELNVYNTEPTGVEFQLTIPINPLT